MKRRRDNTGTYLMIGFLFVFIAVSGVAIAIIAQREQGFAGLPAKVSGTRYVNGKAYDRLELGMSRADVIKVLGDGYTSEIQMQAGAGDFIVDVEALGWRTGKDSGIIASFGEGKLVTKIRCRKGDQFFPWKD